MHFIICIWHFFLPSVHDPLTSTQSRKTSTDRVLILLISSLSDLIIPAVFSAALYGLMVVIAERKRLRAWEGVRHSWRWALITSSLPPLKCQHLLQSGQFFSHPRSCWRENLSQESTSSQTAPALYLSLSPFTLKTALQGWIV